MKSCPITLEPIPGEAEYSLEGLAGLTRGLRRLEPLPFSAQEQLREAVARAPKMSVQGIQPKLSAILRVKEGAFELVETGGKFILKPPHPLYPQTAENEALTMSLARLVGIEIPVHGLIRGRDGSWTYFIKRFDRVGRNGKLPLEDFAQISGASRDTKYESSMEKVAQVIEANCTFPLPQKHELFRRVLFCFLTGNEDMHLKNFSLITRLQQVELSPAYDLLNTTLLLRNPNEETALPIRGKKRRLNRADLITYFAVDRLGLPQKIVDETLKKFQGALPVMQEMIGRSYLSEENRRRYLALFLDRAAHIGLGRGSSLEGDESGNSALPVGGEGR